MSLSLRVMALYGICLLLDSGLQAGFWPWGIGLWLPTAIVIGLVLLPLESFILMSLPTAVLFDGLMGSDNFWLTKFCLAISLVALVVSIRGYGEFLRQKTSLIVFVWLVCFSLYLIDKSVGWTDVRILSVVTMALLVQAMVWVIVTDRLVPNRHRTLGHNR